MTNLQRATLCLMLAGAALSLGLPERSAAQAPDSAQQATDSLGAAPRRIPTAEIIPRAEELDAQLRPLAAAAAPEPAMATIDSLLPQSADRVAALLEESDSERLGTMDSRVVDDLRIRWLRVQDQLDEWQATTAGRSQQLDSLDAQFDRARAVWELTADSSTAADLPEAVRGRLVESLASIDSVQAVVRERLDEVLTLTGRLSQQRSTVSDALLRFDAAEAARRRQLFAPGQAPLWRVFGQDGSEPSVGADVRQSLLRDRDVLVAFIAEERSTEIFRLLLFGLVAIGLTLLHRSSPDALGEVAEVSRARAVLARPISAAFLLYLLTARLVHTGVPTVYQDLNRLLLLVPLTRMVPVVIADKRIRAAAYALVGVFALQWLEPSFVSSSARARLTGIGGNLLGLAGLAWFARLASSRSVGGRWQTAFVLYVRAAMLLVGTALAANVFGLVDLADLLLSGVVLGLMGAFALVVGVIIVQAAVRLTLRQPFALRLAAVRHERELIASRFDWAIKVLAMVWWAYFILGEFRVRDPVVDWGVRIVSASLTVGSIDLSLGEVLTFVFVIWASVQLSRLVRFILREDVLPRVELPRGVPRTVTTVTNYVVLGLGFMFAAAAAGFDLSQMTLLVGAFGVGIGFGLQSIVNNFVSGLILLFERPIQVGDTIQVESVMGKATRIGIRATVVRTFDGAEVIVPNASLVAGRVSNWSLSDRMRRFELRVGVAYGTDPQRALDILVRVAREHDGVADDPAPVARLTGFGESSLDLTLFAWASLDDWTIVASDVHVRAKAALEEAGIEIPFPQRDIRVRSSDGLSAPGVEGMTGDVKAPVASAAGSLTAE